MKKLLLLIIIFTCSNALAQVHSGLSTKELQSVQQTIFNRLGKYPPMFSPWVTQSERKVRLDRVVCSEGRVNLYFNESLIQISIREELCKEWEQMVRDTLGKKYADAKIGLFYRSTPIERYIPNVYRKNISRDPKRYATPSKTPALVQQVDDINTSKGLQNRHIALWPSHGYYYDWEKCRWQFQRPALFGTIEDLHTYYYCDKYLIPMLENAGAVVISPRERDRQTNMVIIDNDRSSTNTNVTFSKGWIRQQGGYNHLDTLETENPFAIGTYMKSPHNGGQATYTATMQPGEYAVYVSYKPLNINSSNACYTVKYSGGEKSFRVNQKIGGGWVYLGHFLFDDKATIILTSQGQITADAIRLGGGMGSVRRDKSASAAPRWTEAAKYYMQFSGVPNEIYTQKHSTVEISDYMDDYKSRGDWVNYLIYEQNIPIDVALAMHSNAGIVDSLFGTLAINYTNRGSRNYRNGGSSFAGRDMADIIQTQIVDDIRALHDSTWTRRSMYDKSYAEVSRPEVPAIIVEMFSHQNFNDMKYALSPEFRFNFARATYKGVLKFLAYRYKIGYQVQPLPVNSPSTELNDSTLRITWQPTVDKLEPSATTEYYKIYTKVGEKSSFDNGVRIEGNSFETPMIADGVARYYKITAVNRGGESFPSKILAACFFPNSKPSLIVNAISPTAPDTVSVFNVRGFEIDPSLSLSDDYSVVGKQVNFDQLSQFVDNDNPGWGATDRSLLYSGVANNAIIQTNVLLNSMITNKQSFITTSENTLCNKRYSPDNLYIITSGENSDIMRKYKQLMPANTEITIIPYYSK